MTSSQFEPFQSIIEQQFVGDEQFFLDTVNIFLTSWPNLQEELRSLPLIAHEQELLDVKKATLLYHKLKGTLGVFGQGLLYSKIKADYEAIKAQNLKPTRALAFKLESDISLFVDSLKAFLKFKNLL